MIKLAVGLQVGSLPSGARSGQVFYALLQPTGYEAHLGARCRVGLPTSAILYNQCFALFCRCQGCHVQNFGLSAHDQNASLNLVLMQYSPLDALTGPLWR